MSLGYKTNLAQNTMRLNVASGFRAPNLAELTNGVHEGTNRYKVGNENLKTEKKRTNRFEFGIQQ
jgi:iron complex outermembrane receptor protein